MLNDSRSVLDDGGERATLAIGSFRLDVDTVTLYRGNDPLPVGRRAVALLSALAKRQGLVVSKDELIQAAWSGLVVEESNLSVQIAALRKALAAEPGGARWIETLPRRGYRFVGPTTASSHHSAIDEEKASPAQGVRLAILSPGAAGGRSQEGSAIARRSRWLVGRNGPLATLDKVTQRMLAGDRQVVFITGEAGIGKTSFIEMAMEQLSRYRVETLCGFCTERFGINETFLPLIDSLTTRCRGSDGSSVLEAVRAHAPTWLLQMPSFLDVADRAAFRNEVFGATRERMSREFCDLVEALSVDRPWVLVIEDMHWSDFQTVDVLSRFAHGDRQAQVLVLATYRVGDSIMSGHPVRRLHQDLEIHGRCSELQLDRLSKTEVEHHLALRFQDEKLASALSGPMFARTQGQPLFIASLVDYLVNHESIVEIDGAWRIGSGTALSEDVVPKDLINMITHRIDRLSEDEQQLLEAASVAGSECAAALVAAGLSRDTVETEEVLEGLARKNHTLVSSGVSEWPDGTYSGSYAFHHILYQNVLYQRLTPARRLQIHQRMGERLEQGYAGRTENIASTLALHFEQSRDFPRALRYLSQAAENSAKRLGHEEATNYLSRALGILDRLGTTDQYGPRTNLLRQRSWAWRSTGDLAGSVRDLEEMIACAADAGQLRHEVNGLLAVSRFCLHADRRMCLHASSEALAKSEALEDDAFKALVQGSSASINLWLKGWQEQDAALCEKALHVTADARDHGTLIRRYGIEGILECLRSRYEECRRSGTDGKKLAQEVGDVYIFVLFNVMESTALIHLGQWRRLQREAVAALALAERNANRPAIALCRLTLAWLHVEAMDFYGARDLCEGVDQAVLEDNPFAFFFQRAVLAKAFVGLNEPQRARQQFDDVMQRLDSDGIMMDYTIYAQLHHCLCEYSLQVGDIAQARTSATKLYEYVAPAPDRNHLAQAHGLLTRVALAAGDLEEARAELSRALSTLGDADMPLAAWRVYRAGIEVCESLGEPTEAARYRARFEDVIRTLAGNFEPDDRLRSSLLAALDAPGRAEPAASGG